MTEVLKTGLSGTATFSVTPEYTAAAMGSGDLPVLATPALIAFMERTAKDSLLAHLPAGATTVGTRISVSHLAPTLVGRTVRVESCLTEVEDRRLRFTLQAFDESGLVGKGEHERCLVFSEAFMERATERAESGITP